MSDVFLSYASANEVQARRVAVALRAMGYGVWRDDELPPHRPYSEVIEERLKQAKAVVVVWSAEAVKSHWVRAEADFARGEGRLVQVTADGTVPPMPFNQIQCVDLSRWKGDSAAPLWRKVVDSVAELVGAPPTVEAASSHIESPAHTSAHTPGRRRALVTAAITGVVLAVAGAGGWLLRERWLLRQASDNPTVAVAPFKALSADAATRDFVTAADSEIVGALTENQQPAAPPGRATFIVEGAARTQAQQLLVRVSLRRRGSDAILWSTQYLRPPSQTATLPSDIAVRTAGVVAVAADALREGGAKLDPVIFALFTNGLDDPSLDATERLVRTAPDFAPGRARRALHLILSGRLAPPAQFAELRRRSLAEAQEALRLDPRVEGAYLALSLGADGTRWAEREAILRRCQKVALGHDCELVLASLLTSAGRAHEAVALARGNPQNRSLIGPSGATSEALYTSGDVEAATSEAAAMLAIRPDDWSIKQVRLMIVAFAGSTEEAFKLLDDPAQRSRELGPGTVETFRLFLTAKRSGLPADRAKAVSAIVGAAGAKRLLRLHAIPMLNLLGATDEAFQLADIYSQDSIPLRSGLGLSTAFLFGPATASMRTDPRFVPIVRRLGLIDYWKSSGVWPDFCDDEPKSVCPEIRRQAG